MVGQSKLESRAPLKLVSAKSTETVSNNAKKYTLSK